MELKRRLKENSIAKLCQYNKGDQYVLNIKDKNLYISEAERKANKDIFCAKYWIQKYIFYRKEY